MDVIVGERVPSFFVRGIVRKSLSSCMFYACAYVRLPRNSVYDEMIGVTMFFLLVIGLLFLVVHALGLCFGTRVSFGWISCRAICVFNATAVERSRAHGSRSRRSRGGWGGSVVQ